MVLKIANGTFDWTHITKSFIHYYGINLENLVIIVLVNRSSMSVYFQVRN